jgi:hypothetical protein
MTLQEARELVKKTKYITWTESQSKQLQEKLFAIGCEWRAGGQKVMHTNDPFLFVDQDLLISFGEKKDYNKFDDSRNLIKSPDEVISIEIWRSEEDRKMLIKDLAGRLPYGVKILFCGNTYTLEGIRYTPDSAAAEFNVGFCGAIEDVQPYLFPLTSMTDEQLKEMQEIIGNPNDACISVNTSGLELWLNSIDTDPTIWLDTIFEVQNWLNKNHFDYRGLIEKGLAINATNLNIY